MEKYQGTISTQYYGRAGNQIFQYAYMMNMACMYHHKPLTPPPDIFLKATDYTKNSYFGATGDVPRTPCIVQVNDNLARAFKNGGCGKYSNLDVYCSGYFQDPELYDRAISKSLFVLPEYTKNTEDIVIHLRLADYWWRRVDAVIHLSLIHI